MSGLGSEHPDKNARHLPVHEALSTGDFGGFRLVQGSRVVYTVASAMVSSFSFSSNAMNPRGISDFHHDEPSPRPCRLLQQPPLQADVTCHPQRHFRASSTARRAKRRSSFVSVGRAARILGDGISFQFPSPA